MKISISIGELIKNELKKQGRSVVWMAKELGYSRGRLYKLFNRNWIYIDLLYKISWMFRHDFFKYYSEELEKYFCSIQKDNNNH